MLRHHLFLVLHPNNRFRRTGARQTKNRYFIPKFIEQQQKMSAKSHNLRKSYYLCNNTLRGKCKFILAERT